MTRRLRLGLAAAALAAAAIAPVLAGSAGAARRAPVVKQMVVFKSGRAVQKRVSARSVLISVGRRRCRAGTGTALAALVRFKPGRVRLHDFGSCSRRAADGAGLFVRSIRGERNRGQDGWVYKVGRRAATAGAADPSGPFGTGRRLRKGQRVTWFYCRLVAGGCQRSLVLRLTAQPGVVLATVVGYDDEGSGIRVEGATVRVGDATAVTTADGTARLSLAAGSYRAYAGKSGLVRSFTERVEVP